jgi:hypothetical protein
MVSDGAITAGTIDRLEYWSDGVLRFTMSNMTLDAAALWTTVTDDLSHMNPGALEGFL